MKGKDDIMKNGNESGIALITALLILVLMGALLHVFVIKIYSSQRMIGMDMQKKVFIRSNNTGGGS
jgi:Tfp pilus assembly protein PilX